MERLDVTEVDVLSVLLSVGVGAKLRLGPICRRLGQPDDFQGNKQIRGQKANSNGGNMVVHNHLMKLRKKGLVTTARVGETGAYDYALHAQAVNKLLNAFDSVWQ